MSIFTATIGPDNQRLVVVHDGARGPRGLTGLPGPEGPAGEAINIRGTWQPGQEYCSLDAVTWRSSAAQGIQSLYIQIEGFPRAPSTVDPHLDPSRWTEVGATDLSNVTGAIWEIYQIDHQFEWVGTPVAFSYAAGRWIKADNRWNDEIAIAVVRDVLSPDRAILQTSGEVPNLDPRVILPNGSAWEVGRLYAVSSVRGRVERLSENDVAWSDPAGSIQAILMPTKFHATVDDLENFVGVALPWKPAPYQPVRKVVGYNKFYFSAADGQTEFTGVDLRGNDLAYEPNTGGSDQTDVFLNGTNLISNTDFTATDGTTLTLAAAATAGDILEVWTPQQSTEVVIPGTAAKLDNLETLFDGVRTDFPITVDSNPVFATDAASLSVFLDATRQEAYTDYDIIIDPGNPDASLVRFAAPPLPDYRFWGIIAIPVGETRVSIPFWDPGITWEPGELCYYDDTSFPAREAGTWYAIWQNTSGASIFPAPTFDPADGWTPISRPLNNEVMLRVRPYDPTRPDGYALGDQVYVPAAPGDDPNQTAASQIWECRVSRSTPGTFVAAEWKQITDLATRGHNPAWGYRPGEGVFMADYERSGFVAYYRNDTGAVIDPGAFVGDPTAPGYQGWTRVRAVSAMEGLADVNLQDLRTRQRLIYDEAASEWANDWDAQEVVWTAQPVDPALAEYAAVQYNAVAGRWEAASADPLGSTFPARGIAYNIRVDAAVSPNEVADIAVQGVVSRPAHGLTVGTTYYLSDTVAGEITAAAPTGLDAQVQAVLVPIDADNLLLLDAIGAVATAPEPAPAIAVWTPGDDYAAGTFVSFDEIIYRVVSDITGAPTAPLPATVEPQTPGIRVWTPGENYEAGAFVSFDAVIYRVLNDITGAGAVPVPADVEAETPGIREWTPGAPYPAGAFITFGGVIYRVTSVIASAPATPDPATVEPQTPGVRVWTPGENYEAGAFVSFGEIIYRVVSDIVTAPATPAPATVEPQTPGIQLWTPGVFYPAGAFVSFNETIYRVTADIAAAPTTPSSSNTAAQPQNLPSTVTLTVGSHAVNAGPRTAPTDRELVEKAWVIAPFTAATLAAGLTGTVETRLLMGGALVELRGTVSAAGGFTPGLIATIATTAHRPLVAQLGFMAGNDVGAGDNLSYMVVRDDGTVLLEASLGATAVTDLHFSYIFSR